MFSSILFLENNAKDVLKEKLKCLWRSDGDLQNKLADYAAILNNSAFGRHEIVSIFLQYQCRCQRTSIVGLLRLRVKQKICTSPTFLV